MTHARVRPGPVSGRITAPPSKSYTHRALVVGHLSGRSFSVDGPLDADDTRATARALGALGTPVTRGRGYWTVHATRPRRARRAISIDCGESGTTLRFVAALAALHAEPTRLTGEGQLGSRPLAPLLRALRSLGAMCRTREHGPHLPVTISGPIDGGRVDLDASESSQFASALLLTLPTRPHSSTLRLTGPIVSEPYIAATRAVVSAHGVTVRGTRRVLRIPGGQHYSGSSFRVPGDASSAAYLWTAAAITGGRVRVDGVSPVWPQADLAVLDLLKRAGAEVHSYPDGVSVWGRSLRPFIVDLTGAPDLYPLAGVLAAVTPGRSRLRGAPHVALKESDRRAGTVRIAEALGAQAHLVPGGLDVSGTREPRAFSLLSETDHRIVMSAAVGALSADRTSTVGDARVVAKSFPGFWSAISAIGAEVHVR